MNDYKKYKDSEVLLYDLGIDEPNEIEINAIAKHCRATVRYEHLTGCEGRIIGNGDEAIITVNINARVERQRFSAAHELAHWLYDRGQIAFSCTDKMFYEEWSKSNRESRANKYAADLLLPKAMFGKLAKNKEMTFMTVKELAKTFVTSMTATAIRLVDLGSFPAMLVCNSSKQIKWFIRGPFVPEKIWPQNTPGKDSIAYDILNGKSVTNKPVDVYAGEWIKHYDADRYEIREHSMKITTDLVLTMLWWKDESQLLDIES